MDTILKRPALKPVYVAPEYVIIVQAHAHRKKMLK
jgi:hypothetical protein